MQNEKTKYIYIVRHGETFSNAQGRLQGWTDGKLNENGIRLAEETGKGLGKISFDRAYSSSLSRARQTAEIILRETGNELPIIIDDRIKEINAGIMEDRRMDSPEDEAQKRELTEYFQNPLHAPGFPGGESVREVMARTQEFLKELAGEDFSCALVATHGCTLRCMLNFLYDDPADFWQGQVPYNCCVNVVTVKNGELRLAQKDAILYDKSLCVDRYKMR